MDKTIKELYVSPELESLEMAMEQAILDGSVSDGNNIEGDDVPSWGGK